VYRFPSTKAALRAFSSAAVAGVMICAGTASALEIQPGIGVGVEYTDNVRLTAVDESEDTIGVGYVGARISENSGPFSADATASLNYQRYTKDSYPDRRYFNLGATAGWEMVKNRFNWLLQDYFSQRPINTFDAATPDNIQDNNIFTFGANINVPVSGLQTFTLRPEYRSFYYEGQTTDNQQYSLTANWNYQIYRLTSVGLSASLRNVDYDEPGVATVTYSSVYFVLSGKRVRSDFSTDLGVTRVERGSGRSTDGFAGKFNWLVNLTSRSSIRTYIATDLTDSSNGALRAVVDPGTGNPDDIQLTTDVIRNKVMTVGYNRRDGALNSSVTGELREMTYSKSPDNDRRIKALTASFNYPLTPLLSSGFYARYSNSEQINTVRTDNEYTVGVNMGYSLSRKLHSKFDVKYNNRTSTQTTQDYNEFSAFVSLVYGFGKVTRPGHGGY
jgi:hypothetical protein